MGEFLKQDIQVLTPYKSPANYTGITIDPAKGMITCTAIIENFSWAGGLSDPLCIRAYISAQNAQAPKSKMQSTLKTTAVKKLAWWICNFNLDSKAP